MANAPAGWYPVDDGRLRWWNGILWTDHFHEPAANLPPDGWYADTRPGWLRWWDGATWTDDYYEKQLSPSIVEVAAPTLPTDPGVRLYQRLRGTGDVGVVGESYYQATLERLTKQVPDETEMWVAALLPEPTNEHDRHAVRVDLVVDAEHHKVGYIAREDARPYSVVLSQLAAQGRIGTVEAKVWRGGSIQVYLRLDEPSNLLPPVLPDPNGVFLDGMWSATVTGEEQHQDVLAAAIRNKPYSIELFSLGFCKIAKGKSVGLDAIEVFLDGQRVGQLTRMITERYENAVEQIVADGKVPYAQGVIQPQGERGLQVTLMMPEGR